MDRLPITADQNLVRRLNSVLILDLLRRFAPLSRAELSGRSGLNRSTVSSIISSLVEDGFVQETELQGSRVGRPGMDLVLNPRGGFAVGVELGVDFISVVTTDFTANILWSQHAATDPRDGQAHILEQALAVTKVAVDHGLEQGLRPLGIGIAVAGLVDSHQGKLMFAPNLGWRDVPLSGLWTERFRLPVFVENEANAAAVGEYYFGTARGVENFIFLSAGIGLGGGIMIGGKLFRGKSGYASEVGHMMIDPQGELCGCGKRGCWETLVGPRAVLRRVRKQLQAGATSSLKSLSNGDLEKISFEMVCAAAGSGDAVALQVLQEVGQNLGFGIANLLNIFNPELVVLGGALNCASAFLMPVVEKTAHENALELAYQGVHLVPSAFGDEAAVIGAVALVLDDIFNAN